MSTRTTVQNAFAGVAQPVDGADADQPEQVVHDPEHRVQEHAPDQADHHGVDQQRQEQDEIVDVLATLDRVQHQRDGEAQQELEDHDRGDEAQRDPERVTELDVAESAPIVRQPDEVVVHRMDQGVVESAGVERKEDREQDDQEQRGQRRRGHLAAELPIAPGDGAGCRRSHPVPPNRRPESVLQLVILAQQVRELLRPWWRARPAGPFRRSRRATARARALRRTAACR